MSPEDLLLAIRDALPPSVVVRGGAIDAAAGELFPEEEAVIVGAVHKRRREFRAGRTYARQALSTFGQSDTPILTGRNREPVWPLGFVGSITHTRSFCAVVVSRRTDTVGLGLDVETDSALETRLVSMICRDDELRHRAEMESLAAVDLPKLIFVAKEALFKLYNTLTNSPLEFNDVCVSFKPRQRRFVARLMSNERPACHGRRRFEGRFGLGFGHAFACVQIANAENVRVCDDAVP